MTGLLPITTQASFLRGVPVVLSEYVEPGGGFAMDPGPFGFPAGLVMHPLDAIAVQHGDDLNGRMRAAVNWTVARANRRLDALLDRLDA